MIANFLIQTYASVVRIEKYLEEDEVPEWVSWQSENRMAGAPPSSTSPSSYASAVISGGSQSFDDRVGFDNASFAWISPNKEDKDPKSKKPAAKPKPTLSQRIKGIFKKQKAGGDAEAPEADEESEEDKPFELHNMDVWFKLGTLNLISGPTGSGKSSGQPHPSIFVFSLR